MSEWVARQSIGRAPKNQRGVLAPPGWGINGFGSHHPKKKEGKKKDLTIKKKKEKKRKKRVRGSTACRQDSLVIPFTSLIFMGYSIAQGGLGRRVNLIRDLYRRGIFIKGALPIFMTDIDTYRAQEPPLCPLLPSQPPTHTIFLISNFIFFF